MGNFNWIDVQMVAQVCEEFGVEELWVRGAEEPGGPRAAYAPGFVGVQSRSGVLEASVVLSKAAPASRNVDAPLSDALSALLGRAVIVSHDEAGSKSTGASSAGSVKLYGAGG
jgi:hypothetical protein